MKNTLEKTLLKLEEEGKLEVSTENFYPRENHLGNFIAHSVEVIEPISPKLEEYLEYRDIEFLYPEFEHISNVREQMEECKMSMDFEPNDEKYLKLYDDLYYYLSGGYDDVYDYSKEPLIYIDGILI